MDKESISSVIIYLTNHLEPTIISNLKYPIYRYSSDTNLYYIYDGDSLIGEFRKDSVIGIFIEKDPFILEIVGEEKNECPSKS